MAHVDIDEDFETLSGLIFWQLGRIPKCTDSIQWRGWKFEVVDMDGQRIDKVLVSRRNADGPPAL